MSLTVEVHNSNSFHPVSKASFRLARSLTEFTSGNCSVHLFYRLPSSLFVDPYELAQRQELYTFVKWGQVDLEKPVHAVANSDTDVLVNVPCPPIPSTDVNKEMEVTVEVPLHARYGFPIPGESFSGTAGNYRDIVLDFPKAFVAYSTYNDSPLNERAQTSSTRPLYLSEAQLHQVGLSPESTRFVPVPLSSSIAPLRIRIPVGSGGDLFAVQCGTALVIFISFAWVLFTATRMAVRLSSEGHSVHRKVD